jgi:predicted Zn-dependent protease
MAPLYDALGEGAQTRYALDAARRAAPRDATVAAALGAAYEERALYDRAMEEWKRALRLAPGNIEVTLALASLYVSLGWSLEARTLLESARRRAPREPGVLIAMAMQEVQNARTRDAEEHLNAAKRLAPEDERIDSLLSHVYDLEGRRTEAMGAIRRALARRPEEADYLIQWADLLLADPDATAARQAEEAYRRALAAAAGDPRAVLGLGRALRRQGRFAEALQVLLSLTRRPRPDPGALRELGQVQSRLGRASEAQASLARAERFTEEADALQRAQMQVAMRPDVPERRRDLAALYLKQGDPARAIVELKRILENRPADSAARALLRSALRKAGRED